MSFSSAFWLMRSFCRFPKCAYWFSKQTDKLESAGLHRRCGCTVGRGLAPAETWQIFEYFRYNAPGS